MRRCKIQKERGRDLETRTYAEVDRASPRETETSDHKYRWSDGGRTWGRWKRRDGGANKKQRKSNE